MKLRKYNEASFSDSDWFKKIAKEAMRKPAKDYDMLFLKAIFNDVLIDVKDLLDDHFVEVLDREAQTTMVRVNKADHIGFYGRYRILGNYSKADKTLSGYAKSFGSLASDFLDIETGLKHLELEFKNESIFGKEFPIATIEHRVDLTQNNDGVSYVFILDIKF
jgi:hypothetical protein